LICSVIIFSGKLPGKKKLSVFSGYSGKEVKSLASIHVFTLLNVSLHSGKLKIDGMLFHIFLVKFAGFITGTSQRISFIFSFLLKSNSLIFAQFSIITISNSLL